MKIAFFQNGLLAYFERYTNERAKRAAISSWLARGLGFEVRAS